MVISVKLYILLLLLVPSFAYGAGWTSVRSANFHLIGDASEAEIRAAALRLEEFRGAFTQLFPSLKLNVPGVRTNVVVFRNAASYRPFKPKRPDGSTDESVAGYFQAGDGANYITLSAPDAAAENFGTIFHEYVHFLIDANFEEEELPPWLNEGLAEYFETLRVTGGRSVSLGEPRNDHLRLLRRSDLIPLSTQFETDNSSLHGGGDDSRSLFYAQSWALVYYLIGNGKENDRERFDRILSLVTGRRNPEKAVREIFGQTDAEFEKTLNGFIDQPTAAGATFIIPGIVSGGSLSAKPLSEAETNAYLGDLLYHSNRDREAADFLRKALTLEPKLAMAHGSLGLLLMRQEKYAEAKKHLEIAVAANDPNSFVVFNYAYSMIREAMNEKEEVTAFAPELRRNIESALRRAVGLRPDFAESYRLLAFIRLVSGKDLEEAANLAKKAVSLDPANDEHALLLALIYLNQEKYADARAAAESLAMLSSAERVRVDARAVIQAADEYFSANAAVRKSEITVIPGYLPPLILKRSQVTDAEMAGFDKDLIINNLNRLLPRPGTGEKQITGFIDRIQCLGDRVNYSINAAGQRSVFTSSDLLGLRMSVLTDGEQAFRVECGAGFGKQLLVLGFRPPTASDSKSKPELVSITFVPDMFYLKTPEEMAKARVIIVEDDTPRKTALRKSGTEKTP